MPEKTAGRKADGNTRTVQKGESRLCLRRLPGKRRMRARESSRLKRSRTRESGAAKTRAGVTRTNSDRKAARTSEPLLWRA